MRPTRGLRLVLSGLLAGAALLKLEDGLQWHAQAGLVWAAVVLEALLSIGLILQRSAFRSALGAVILGCAFAGYHTFAILLGLPSCRCLGRLYAGHYVLLGLSLAVAVIGALVCRGMHAARSRSSSGQ